MKKETRAGKFGRFLAQWIDYTIDTLPEEQREAYRKRLITEIKTYSLDPSDRTWELTEMDNLNPTNPEELAKTNKELMHLTYLKTTTSRRLLEALLENL